MKAYELHLATRRCKLSASERLLLREIAMYASGDEGECRASQETLALDTGLGERTVRRLMTKLVRAGILERASRKGALRIMVAAIPGIVAAVDPATEAGTDPAVVAGEGSGVIAATVAGIATRDEPIPAMVAAMDPAMVAGTVQNSGHHGRYETVTLDGVPATMATIPATMAGHSGHHGRRSVVVLDPSPAEEGGRPADEGAGDGGGTARPEPAPQMRHADVVRPSRGEEPEPVLVARLMALQREDGHELLRHSDADQRVLLAQLRQGRTEDWLTGYIEWAEARGIHRLRWATLFGASLTKLRAEYEDEAVERECQRARWAPQPTPERKVKPIPEEYRRVIAAKKAEREAAQQAARKGLA